MRVCVFTMTYNERFFLPIWHAYYAAQFGADNLFVIDHGSDDGSTAFLRKNVKRISRKKPFDEDIRAAYASAFLKRQLRTYDVVLFTDVDEIVVADPRAYPDLRSYLSAHTQTVIAPTGLALLHIEDLEQPYDREQPILRQRQWVRYHHYYSKPTISRVGLKWEPGFHDADIPAHRGENLYMFHLKAFDKTAAHGEMLKRRKIIFSKSAEDQNHSFQFHMKTDEYDNTYFFTTSAHVEQAVPFQTLQDIRTKPAETTLRESFGPLAKLPDAFADCIPIAAVSPAVRKSVISRLFGGKARDGDGSRR